MVILIGFILNQLLIEVCDNVDTAFGNNLGIDSICVLAAFITFKWALDKLICFGQYSYSVVLKDEKLCLLLNVLVGAITGIIVFALRDFIPHLYSLTTEQYSLFSKCLVVYSMGTVIHAISEFLYMYLLYSNKMKMVYGMNVLYYALLFSTDYMVIKNGFDLSVLIGCTVVCEAVYCLIIFIISDFRKTNCNFSFKNTVALIKHGLNIMFEQVITKIATLFFQCCASRLGTELFAIHSVCFSVSVLLESYTYSMNVFTVSRLSKVKTILHKYRAHFWIIRKYGLFVLSLVAVSIMPALLLLHGSVPIKDCIPFVFVYCLDSIVLLIYEVSDACLVSAQRTDILKFESMIGIAVRIPLILLTLHFKWGLVGFALSIILDFTARVIYNEIKLRQISEARLYS